MRDRQVVAQAASELRPHWPKLAAIALLELLAMPLTLLNPLPLKLVVDSVVGSRPPPGPVAALLQERTQVLLFAVTLQVALVLASQLHATLGYAYTVRTGESIILALRARLFGHVQRLSVAFHDSRGVTDTLYRIQYDTPAIQNISIYGVLPVVTALLTLVSMIYVTASLNWHLAIVALTIIPAMVILTQIYRKRVTPWYQDLKALESGAFGVVQEVLSAVRVVKAYGREEIERTRFEEASQQTIRKQVRISIYDGMFNGSIGLTTAIGMAACLFIGTKSVLAGTMSLGDLILILGYLTQLYGPLTQITTQLGTIQSSMVSLHRVYETLATTPDVVEHASPRRMARARGTVEFESVSFWYDPRQPILSNISLTVPDGTRLGIAGRTGAGKTTFISLLTRFYDPRRGRILLDGIDIRELHLADLRSQFSIVLQEPVLFSTSIRENIRYARPDATEQDVVDAAVAANAHDFILAQPDGYGTEVGNRGQRLSGGERQRIALARAFLKDAPILILDEPTSSVDVHTEATIMNAMERLMAGRTTLMIAHRLTTLDSCDAIIELSHGRIAAARTPQGQALSIGG